MQNFNRRGRKVYAKDAKFASLCVPCEILCVLCGKIKIEINRKGRKVYAKFARFTYPLRPLRNPLRSLR